MIKVIHYDEYITKLFVREQADEDYRACCLMNVYDYLHRFGFFFPSILN